MTTKTIKCYKGLPIKVNCKANGYWDYNEVKTFDASDAYNITMKSYDGLTTKLLNSNVTPKSIDFETSFLPNYTYVNGQTAVLMPYDNGKVYHNVKIEQKYVYFKNYGCTISNNKILSGFSTSNYAQINKTFPNSFTSFKAIFKITTGSSLTSHHNCVFGNNGSANVSIIIRNTSKFSYYTGSWVEGKTELNTNTAYWFCVNYANNNFTGYILADNGSYTLDTLPDLSQWSTEWTSSTNIFAGNIFNIGYNKNSTSEYFTGSFDLNNCKIWVNNEEFWYYDEITFGTVNLNGCLYNYTDTGAASTLNCFYYNDKYLLTSDNDIANSYYLGTVEVPTHDLYNYTETSQTVYDNFTIVGSSVTINQENGQVDNFSSSSYLDTKYYFPTAANTPWKMRVNFKYNAVTVSQYYIACDGGYLKGPYIATNKTHNLDCGVGFDIGRAVSDFVLENNTNYTAEWTYDGIQTYTLRYKKENEGWQVVGTVTSNQNVLQGQKILLGNTELNAAKFCQGTLNLANDTYIEVNNTQVWIPTTVHYTGQWERL